LSTPVSGIRVVRLVQLALLWGGFVLSSDYDSHRVVEASKSGMVFGFLTAVVAFWLFDPPGGGQGNA
jgi:hypothetical protein